MDRRAFLGAVGAGLLAAPLAAEAQPAGKIYRLGFLGGASASGYASQLAALRQGFRDLGYEEGRNLAIEYRWAEGKYDRLPALAAELVRLNVDLIVTHGAPGSLAAKQATTTIPIVMAIVGDPVDAGLVTSLARPGGNITGLSFFGVELTLKRLELLKEAVPRIRRVAVLLNPDNPVQSSDSTIVSTLRQTAKSLGVELHLVGVREPPEFQSAFSRMVTARSEAMVVLDDAMLIAHASAIAALANAKLLPGIGFKECAVAGGLMAYAVDFPAIWRQAAALVDKILKGQKPGDLPIERATRFETIINLKTAKALGLTIPPSVLARADEVIQ